MEQAFKFGPQNPPHDYRIANRPGNPSWKGVADWFDKAAMPDVKVDTSQYEYTWGRKPRGLDYWVFQIGRQLYSFYGSFRQCVSAARLAAQDEDVMAVELMP